MTRVRRFSPILIALLLWGVTAAATPLTVDAQESATTTADLWRGASAV